MRFSLPRARANESMTMTKELPPSVSWYVYCDRISCSEKKELMKVDVYQPTTSLSMLIWQIKENQNAHMSEIGDHVVLELLRVNELQVVFRRRHSVCVSDFNASIVIQTQKLSSNTGGRGPLRVLDHLDQRLPR